jgi:hypothetical protein
MEKKITQKPQGAASMTHLIFWRSRITFVIGCVLLVLVCAVAMAPGSATAG